MGRIHKGHLRDTGNLRKVSNGKQIEGRLSEEKSSDHDSASLNTSPSDATNLEGETKKTPEQADTIPKTPKTATPSNANKNKQPKKKTKKKKTSIWKMNDDELQELASRIKNKGYDLKLKGTESLQELREKIEQALVNLKLGVEDFIDDKNEIIHRKVAIIRNA